MSFGGLQIPRAKKGGLTTWNLFRDQAKVLQDHGVETEATSELKSCQKGDAARKNVSATVASMGVYPVLGFNGHCNYFEPYHSQLQRDRAGQNPVIPLSTRGGIKLESHELEFPSRSARVQQRRHDCPSKKVRFCTEDQVFADNGDEYDQDLKPACEDVADAQSRAAVSAAIEFEAALAETLYMGANARLRIREARESIVWPNHETRDHCDDIGFTGDRPKLGRRLQAKAKALAKAKSDGAFSREDEVLQFREETINRENYDNAEAASIDQETLQGQGLGEREIQSPGHYRRVHFKDIVWAHDVTDDKTAEPLAGVQSRWRENERLKLRGMEMQRYRASPESEEEHDDDDDDEEEIETTLGVPMSRRQFLIYNTLQNTPGFVPVPQASPSSDVQVDEYPCQSVDSDDPTEMEEEDEESQMSPWTDVDTESALTEKPSPYFDADDGYSTSRDDYEEDVLDEEYFYDCPSPLYPHPEDIHNPDNSPSELQLWGNNGRQFTKAQVQRANTKAWGKQYESGGHMNMFFIITGLNSPHTVFFIRRYQEQWLGLADLSTSFDAKNMSAIDPSLQSTPEDNKNTITWTKNPQTSEESSHNSTHNRECSIAHSVSTSIEFVVKPPSWTNDASTANLSPLVSNTNKRLFDDVGEISSFTGFLERAVEEQKAKKRRLGDSCDSVPTIGEDRISNSLSTSAPQPEPANGESIAAVSTQTNDESAGIKDEFAGTNSHHDKKGDTGFLYETQSCLGKRKWAEDHEGNIDVQPPKKQIRTGTCVAHAECSPLATHALPENIDKTSDAQHIRQMHDHKSAKSPKIKRRCALLKRIVGCLPKWFSWRWSGKRSDGKQPRGGQTTEMTVSPHGPSSFTTTNMQHPPSGTWSMQQMYEAPLGTQQISSETAPKENTVKIQVPQALPGGWTMLTDPEQISRWQHQVAEEEEL